jgi:hypothetical protein
MNTVKSCLIVGRTLAFPPTSALADDASHRAALSGN